MENVLIAGPSADDLGGNIKSLLSLRSRVACVLSSLHGDGRESGGDRAGLMVYETVKVCYEEGLVRADEQQRGRSPRYMEIALPVKLRCASSASNSETITRL